MGLREVALDDRTDLSQPLVLLNGSQALVRLVLAQRARDAAAGLNTAGLVTGYRGSPLGAVDQQMNRAAQALEKAQILFQAALNEDLAATALWGAQQAELTGESKYDGVFGLWYGKGPGVDRSGDAFRHVNMAGTSPHGGVVVVMGDDHTGESSTTCHQSDFALIDAAMPILSPAGVQEILDFGHYGYALSRYAGVWAGLKAIKDTVEVTAVVDGDPWRTRYTVPERAVPPGGYNIRLGDHWVAQEERLLAHKIDAARAFARHNRIDRRVHGQAGARIGIVAAGKSWLDTLSALGSLGIDADGAAALGLTTYKVAQIWPLDTESLKDWAEGLDLIICVEEKRKIIEPQVKETLFDAGMQARVWGHKAGAEGPVLFQTHYALDPAAVAVALGDILVSETGAEGALADRVAALCAQVQRNGSDDLAARLPWFCSGCPHNSSTTVPEGARAGAGIGCHFMAKWMDRSTEAHTQMGGEGANWIGEAPFSNRPHIFQNIGDGTYNHSGLMAIRAAVAAGTNITYKILFNDAVAMTGGQGNDGGLTPARVAHEVRAAGARKVVVVHDPAEPVDPAAFPPKTEIAPREDLPAVQRRLQEIPGTTALIYVQTCAAEKRRRRRRGAFPDPDRRVFINTDICEGCGDCGVQSNCVALVPVETELGRKRAVDQSACNKDFSCLKGFCPSFVTVEGARPRKPQAAQIELPEMPEPVLPPLDGVHSTVIAGVGGTGAVTIGATMAMAAHIDGKGAAMMEMAGLAQKGGTVHIHVRLAATPADIAAVRISVGECDTLLGGDLVVAGGNKTTSLLDPGRSRGVLNTHETMTGAFTQDADFRIPGADLQGLIRRRTGGQVTAFDATALARIAMGDTIYANTILLGAAWQQGLIPLSHAAIRQAYVLNGAAVAANQRAFEIGRWAVVDPEARDRLLAGDAPARPKTLEEKIAFRADHLTAYQGPRLARRYRAAVARIAEPALREAVAKGYHKLLSYKDEYEVARLHLDTEAKLSKAFEGDVRTTYHLAPPMLPGRDGAGRPRKRAFRRGMRPVFRLLAALRVLRGTPFDPFGVTEERRMERALIATYEADLAQWIAPEAGVPGDLALRIELAELPLRIRGFGPVKAAAAAEAATRRAEILAALADDPPTQMAAE